MKASGKHRIDPGLKGIVIEASQALARLDADRLEELARSCEALNRQVKQGGEAELAGLVLNFRDAAGEMAILERLLDATRVNAKVMNRLRQLREGRLEYGADECAPTGQNHGDN